MTQDKKKEISFFDQFIEKNHEYVGLSEKSYKKLFFELSKSLSSQKQKIKILELGCGTGTFTKNIYSLNNSKVFGCDISRKSIEKAISLYPEINFSVQDIENLSFEDNSFDVVIFSGVLHHFDSLNNALTEAKRVLKKDGLIFSFDPNLHNLFFWLYRRKKSWFYSPQGVTENEEPLTKSKIRNAMKACEFSKIEVYGISAMPYKYIESKKLSVLLPIYNFLDYLLNIVPYIRNITGSFLISKARK